MSEENGKPVAESAAQPKKMNKKRRKKIKKIIIIAAVVLVAVCLFVLPNFMGKNTDALGVYKGDIYVVEEREIERTISATGLVESHEDTTAKVYSTLNYKVLTVNVSVGDRVSEGDILCVYDTETLDRAIREKELTMSSTERTASLNLANARHNYNTYLGDINNEKNAAIVNAQSAYDAAVDAYDDAVADYEEYLSKSDNAEIIALNAAKREYDKAKSDYEDYLYDLENGGNTTLTLAKRNLDKAQSDYDDYLYDLENGGNTTLTLAKRNLDKAKSDYTTLEKELADGTNLELNAARRSMETARDNYEDYQKLVDNDETAELMNASIALDKIDEECDAAVKLRNQYKEEMDAAEEEWQALLNDPNASDVDINKAEQRYNTAKGKYESQCTIVERLREQEAIYEDAYDNAYDAADITLRSYKTAYDNALDNYKSVEKSLYDRLDTYAKAVADAEDNYNAAKASADAQLEVYEKALADAEDNYNAAKDSADTQLANYEKAYKAAEDNYNTALENCEDQLEAYENAVEVAERNMNDAKFALDSAKRSSNSQLETYRIAYENALSGTNTELADYQLANLYEDLKKTEVTSPISGTVTAVYAIEGETPMAGGVLFVIEDTENLVVSSTVKAYDLGKIEVGMPVNIKTDSTGDTVYDGVIESIAPTAVKDQSGNIISTNDAEFETVVTVLDKTGTLRIGVSAKIEYVIAEDENAVVIPLSAVLSDNDGSYVIIAHGADDNKVKLEKQYVTVGISDGIYVSVEGIDAGVQVVDNAKNYVSDIGKTLALSDTDMHTANNGMADMMAMSPMAR